MNYDELETLPISRNTFYNLDIFKNVQFEKLAGFLLSCSTEIVEPGTKLIYPELENQRLIILLEGLLEVKLESQGGEFIDTIKPGHCAGEMSIFDDIKPSATVSAKEKSKLLIIQF